MRIFTRTDRDLAESLLSKIATETAAPCGGVCRPSYGSGETTAWRILADAAADLGLYAGADVAGNLVISIDGRDAQLATRPTLVGSHLDSVPRGGNYDGLAGVVAALLLVAKTREVKHARPIVGLGLRGEESAWFGVPYLGSKAILGKLHQRDLDRRRKATGNHADDGSVEAHSQHPTLRTCMEKIGADPLRLVEVPAVLPDQIAEFWELHIEQGPLLVARGKPVGVVTGIRGNARVANAYITGQAGHSGTTPHELRDDAVVRFAEIMTKLEARRQTLAALGDDLVFTCGIVGTNPSKHAITTIADEIHLSLDVRSLESRRARDFLTYAESLGVDLGEVVETIGAEIASAICSRAARACEDLGVDYGCLAGFWAQAPRSE